MIDIVERLRNGIWKDEDYTPYEETIMEAADELERMRVALLQIIAYDRKYAENTYLKTVDGPCAAIARAALKGTGNEN